MSAAPPTPKRPLVTLKLATSLDGRIATISGASKWITGEEARREGHRLRAAHDVVLVGSGTVLADDPELTARTDPPTGKQPVRMVADARGRTPLDARLFQTLGAAPLVIAVGSREAAERFKGVGAAPPAFRVGVLLDIGWDGPGLRPESLLALAQESGAQSVMIEGGGELAASFVRERLVDRIEWFRAPILLGGDGRACLGAMGLENLANAPTYERVGLRDLGRDLQESYVRKR